MSDGRKPLIIDGEYDQVSRASQDVDALRLAHRTPVTQAEARAMIAALCHRFDVELTLRFTARNGLASFRAVYTLVPRTYVDGTPVLNARGRQKRRKKYLRDEEGRVLWRLSVSLPNKARETTTTGGWGLRAGVVLHEFTHAVIQARGLNMNAAGHGPFFTWLLDGLVADWKSTRVPQEIAA